MTIEFSGSCLVICINHIAVVPLCYVIVRSGDRIRSDVINHQSMNHLLFDLEVTDRLADVNRAVDPNNALGF